MAGAYAWLQHTGLFASRELESVLQELSRQVPLSDVPRSSGHLDVLHVVTQAYATGGPTQAVARWIERDASRSHHICLTQQRDAPIPDKLRAGTRDRSDLTILTSGHGGLMERAAHLRSLASRADLVIVSSHPHDVVPTLAFAATPRRGIVSVNHSDHVFWLGTSVPGILLNMRDSGQRLATARRAVSETRSVVMARPLATTDRAIDRGAAKEHLGLAPDARLIVTIADGAKYRSVGGPSFLDLVTPVIMADPKAVLLAAGPAREGEWLDAERATSGRIRALGLLPDVKILQQAADIYLDSFPFASLTSLLETGSFGTPVVTYRGHPEGCDVLGSDTPGVDEHMLGPTTPDELHDALLGLLGDESRRMAVGALTRQAILSTHTGTGWHDSLERVYDRAFDPPIDDSDHTPSRSKGPLDLLVTLVQAANPFHQGVVGAAKMALPFFPVRDRAKQWGTLAREGNPTSPELLLSPGTADWFTTHRRALGLRRPSRRGH